MKKPVTNFGASVRARLHNDARLRNQDFQFLLQRYAAERLLYRLGASPHRERFVLKGAMLFVLWDGAVHRPTRDLDFAGYWADDEASLVEAFAEVCAIPCDADGILFPADTLRSEPIRHREKYHGFRLRVRARLEAAVIPLQIDVGFGDAIVPPPVDADYPVLLSGAPQPRIRAYPRETAISEKLHAMASLGLENSRFKDFYDVYVLAKSTEFEGQLLSAAIASTFARRDAAQLGDWPVALTPAFYADAERAAEWRRYLDRSKLSGVPAEFGIVGETVTAFLSPPLRAAVAGVVYVATWPPGGPWR